jgi:hypothetical protein
MKCATQLKKVVIPHFRRSAAARLESVGVMALPVDHLTLPEVTDGANASLPPWYRPSPPSRPLPDHLCPLDDGVHLGAPCMLLQQYTYWTFAATFLAHQRALTPSTTGATRVPRSDGASTTVGGARPAPDGVPAVSFGSAKQLVVESRTEATTDGPDTGMSNLRAAAVMDVMAVAVIVVVLVAAYRCSV